MSAIGKPATAHASSGFTLIEMLVTLGIAGLIAGLGFPQLQGQMAAQEWRSSVAGSMAMLRSARATAIRSGGVTTVSLAPKGHGLRLDGRDTFTLPGSVTLVMAAPVHFAGDGSSSGGELLINGRGRTLRISIAQATGLLLARPA
jgi:prepilin-type N-terminal cleavage/methylation domain-containing protein